MISKLIGAVVLMAIGGGLTWYALGHHIVATEDGRVIVPKAELTITDTFVDFSAMSAAELKEHPDLVKALTDHGHGDLVASKIGGSVLDKLKDVISGEDEKSQ